MSDHFSHSQMAHACSICRYPLDIDDDPLTGNCGGDCTLCMAIAGDPDCAVTLVRELEHFLRKNRDDIRMSNFRKGDKLRIIHFPDGDGSKDGIVSTVEYTIPSYGKIITDRFCLYLSQEGYVWERVENGHGKA